jgi:hypothetical protein
MTSYRIHAIYRALVLSRTSHLDRPSTAWDLKMLCDEQAIQTERLPCSHVRLLILRYLGPEPGSDQ